MLSRVLMIVLVLVGLVWLKWLGVVLWMVCRCRLFGVCVLVFLGSSCRGRFSVVVVVCRVFGLVKVSSW